MNIRWNQFEGRRAKLQEELAQRIPVRVLPIPGQNLADLSQVLPGREVLRPEVLRPEVLRREVLRREVLRREVLRREVLRRVPRHLHR